MLIFSNCIMFLITFDGDFCRHIILREHEFALRRTAIDHDMSVEIQQILTIASVWGGAFPPIRYQSAISTQFEITSSPLVTFIFKTFPKNRATQFWKFLPQIWKICNRSQLVSINFEKKLKKFEFFAFFSNESYFFLFENEFYVKNAFFEVLHVDIAQKLQILNFHSFLVIFE